VAPSARGPRPAAGEIRRLAAVARPWLTGAVLIGLGQAVLLTAQAAVLAVLLATAMRHQLTTGLATRDALLIAGLTLGQGLLGWAWEAATEAAARRARAVTRHRALAGAVQLAAAGPPRPDALGPDALGPGGLATLLGAGLDELEPLVGAVLPRAVLALAGPALLLAWIAQLDLTSAVLATGVFLLGPLLAALVGADTAVAVRDRLASLERLGDRFTALVEGLPVLRAFGRAAEHERAVAASGEEVRAATLATLRIALLAGLVLELLAAVGTALVAVRLGLRLDGGQPILPQALAVLILTPEVFLPLRKLTAEFHGGIAGRTVLARLAALPAPVPVTPRSPAPGEPAEVRLDRVSLTVPGRDRPVLDRVDLRVRPGERLCLAGASGAGKSSLLRVVAGLAHPTAGRCRVAGTDPADGRPALGWVPQEPTVLAGTVLDNVALGRPGVGEPAARAALHAAQLGSWLDGLPGGLHTMLSGLGAPLSLGERRRLAVARCLAGPRPALWLLDEPTAGLDPATARSLTAQLGRTLDGATAVIATHDPAALVLGSRTAELRAGRVHVPAGPWPRPADVTRAR
jgi:ABC-type transport system involved in cytochrome bd biosynthesis fused ATPase/permease subunit